MATVVENYKTDGKVSPILSFIFLALAVIEIASTPLHPTYWDVIVCHRMS